MTIRFATGSLLKILILNRELRETPQDSSDRARAESSRILVSLQGRDIRRGRSPEAVGGPGDRERTGHQTVTPGGSSLRNGTLRQEMRRDAGQSVVIATTGFTDVMS